MEKSIEAMKRLIIILSMKRLSGRAAGFYMRLSRKATNYASAPAPTFIV